MKPTPEANRRAVKKFYDSHAEYKLRWKETWKNRREYVNARRNAVSAMLSGYKAERGCRTCGEKDPRCLSFHHLDKDSKTNNVSQMKSGSMEKLMLEVKKCEILCENCHRKLK